MFELGGKLLRALEDNRLPRNDENLKGLGWFLVCVGESLSKGSLVEARYLRKESRPGQMPQSRSLSVALCLMGDQVMDWAAAVYHKEKPGEPQANKQADPPSTKTD